ncbi:hypothetical protein RHMOL_Rhmol11G0099300 [Rhododendron molle]|uniref:Uncharacterized protein n=1 Tax=Rhododendron molle TaxID=49168 RepID=A0ACC0LQ68_RHOML|nr:hypothetical protein RHMOL_Rhmol11G0099300 [Rhododendron molle]
MEELRAFLDDEDQGNDVPVKEELVEEVMRQLWKEINSSPVSEIETPSLSESSPCFLPSVVGDKESCGASFSDSASTLMVGIEGGLAAAEAATAATGEKMGLPAVEGNGSCRVVEERGTGGGVEGVEENGRL